MSAHRVQYPEREPERITAFVSIGFGLSLAHPDATLSGVSYSGLALIAPELIWSLFFISVGALRLLSLKINGRARWTPSARLVAASLNGSAFAMLAAFFAVPFWTAEPANTAALTYAVMAWVDVKNARRIGNDIYAAQRLAGMVPDRRRSLRGPVYRD